MPSPPPLRRALSAPARLSRMSPTAVNRLALLLGNIRLHAAPMNVNNPRKRRRNLSIRRSPSGDKKRARR
jgi:hypothetical protein